MTPKSRFVNNKTEMRRSVLTIPHRVSSANNDWTLSAEDCYSFKEETDTGDQCELCSRHIGYMLTLAFVDYCPCGLRNENDCHDIGRDQDVVVRSQTDETKAPSPDHEAYGDCSQARENPPAYDGDGTDVRLLRGCRERHAESRWTKTTPEDT